MSIQYGAVVERERVAGLAGELGPLSPGHDFEDQVTGSPPAASELPLEDRLHPHAKRVIEALTESYRGQQGYFFAKYEDTWITNAGPERVLQRLFRDGNTVLLTLSVTEVKGVVSFEVQHVSVSVNPFRDKVVKRENWFHHRLYPDELAQFKAPLSGKVS